MSNSHNTTSARQERARNRASIRALNAAYVGQDVGATSEAAALERQRVLHNGGGRRYGNHRKWKAEAKVQQRRDERHTLNKLTHNMDALTDE